MKTVTFTAASAFQMAKLPAVLRGRIAAKIDRYAATGSGDVKALTGLPSLRLRVGDHRAVFTETAEAIIVTHIAHRRDAYR